MIDCSKKFEEFIKNYVVLPADKQQVLRDNKNKNAKRLRDGLKQYNSDNNKCYSIAETRVQGSMAMNTVIQNDSNDYDIDVAIVFDKSNIGDLGPLQARRLVYESLKYKMGQFNEDPELKTNCVRIKYADGYHIDFAVYRRFKEDNSDDYQYEHAGGSSWTARNPKAINDWFKEEVNAKGNELRKVVRLSKTFCKSRSGWVNIPGGLIQSIICDEVYAEGYNRIDEIFYYTLVAIKDRLEVNKEVYNPTDCSVSILTAQNHYDKMDNWLSRLSDKIDSLGILFNDNCKLKDAYRAWGDFFNHSFWNDQVELINEEFSSRSYYRDSRKFDFDDTEEFIEDFVDDINDTFSVNIETRIEANGIHNQLLSEYLRRFPLLRNFIPCGLKLSFEARTDAPYPYEVWWKIKNVGRIAEEKNDIRGQILKTDEKRHTENSQFAGPHYVECYIIKNNECVAMKHVPVKICNETVK